MSEDKPKADYSKDTGTRSWLERLATRRGMTLLALFSVVLLIAAAVGIWYVWRYHPLGLGRTVQIRPPDSVEDLINMYPELEPILSNSELDSVYKEFFIAYQEGGADAALELARLRGILTQDDELRMTLELDTTDSAELAGQLEARGIKVTAASGNVIDIAIPVSLIEAAIESGNPASLFQELPGLEHIVRIRLPRINIQDVGSANIESFEKIGAHLWHQQGYLGEGIRIGVLDMGFDGYKDLLGSDLPDSVTAQSFVYGSEIDQIGTTHGTGCAEIIHDIAPEAEMVFAAYQTDAEMSQAVEWLLAQDVDIISNSTGGIYGPMDGTGPDAEMVNRVVESGVVWVNSAGNSADTHYRAVFTDENGNGFHEFTPNDEMMGFIPDGVVVMVLNWDDWGGGTQDLDLYILDEQQNTLAVSQNLQDSPDDDAAEIIRYEFSDNEVYSIAFFADKISRPVTVNFFLYRAMLEYYTEDYSVTSPADAARSITVGATFWQDDAIEYYSSRGPTIDGRLKPDISAPTRVSVASRDQPFDGTSGAAPHVSGAAALILEAYPDFGPAEVLTFLQSRVVDLGPAGPDYVFGYGRLWLGEAPVVQAVIAPTPTTPAPATATLPPEEGLPTIAPTHTATPKRNPIEEPESSSFDLSSTGVLLLCACVGLPGMLGLGGAGLLGSIWFYRRSRGPAEHPAAPAPMPAPVPPVRVPQDAPASPGARAGQIFCPQCRLPNSPQARFCNNCGFELNPIESAQEAMQFCNYCGQAVRASARFCPNCGRER